MANGWNPLIGFGFTALGVGYLWEAYQKKSTPTPVGGLGYSRGQSVDRRQLPPAPASKNDILYVKDGVREIKFYPAGDINQRVKYIVDQIRKDSQDKRVISEARTLVSGKCPVARGGLDWCIQPKDWNGEIRMLFMGVTNPNSPYAIRYTRDHATVDLFGSSDLLRRLPSGDCDDMAIRLGALLRSIGYSVKCRIVAPAGAPGQWAHIYLVAGSVPGEPNPPRWIPLDPTEPHPPGWEVPKHLISSVRDYEV